MLFLATGRSDPEKRRVGKERGARGAAPRFGDSPAADTHGVDVQERFCIALGPFVTFASSLSFPCEH